MTYTVPPFVHRHNYNGTYDSICTKCFATVSSNLIEAELEDDETTHHCSGIMGCSTIQNVNAQMNHKLLKNHHRSAA